MDKFEHGGHVTSTPDNIHELLAKLPWGLSMDEIRAKMLSCPKCGKKTQAGFHDGIFMPALCDGCWRLFLENLNSGAVDAKKIGEMLAIPMGNAKIGRKKNRPVCKKLVSLQNKEYKKLD